jgi:hypothetical protein
MAGYLGRISAVVTANTTDFTRNIGAAREEMERFARSTRSSVNSYRLNFDTATLDRTLTKLQLFRRTLQEAAGQSIDTGALDQLYEIVEDLSKPLTKVKNDIEGLGNNVQAQLYPAMERAQRGVQRLYNAIADGSTTLQAEARNIAELTRQITLLGNSTAAIKDIENLGKKLDVRNSGSTFLQPRAQESLKRSDVLRGEAAKLSPETRADAFWQTQADMAERNAARIAQAAARVERYRAAIARSAPGDRRDRLVGGLAAAESQLDSRVDRQNRLNAQMELGIAAGRMRDAATSARPSTDADGIDAARVRLTALQATLRSVRPDGAFDAYAASLATMADNAARAAGSAAQLRAQLTQLNAAMDAGERLAAAQGNLNAINKRSAAVGNKFADPRAEMAKTFADTRAAMGPAHKDEIDASQRKNYLSEIVAPRLSGAESGISGLAREFQSQLMPQLKAAQAEMRRLTSENAAPAIGEIRKLRNEVDSLEKSIMAADVASKKLAQFDAATAMNNQPRAIQDFQHDFQMLLNLSGQLNDNLGTQMAGNLQRSWSRVREIVSELATLQQQPATAASAARRTQLLDEVRGVSQQLARELAQLDPSRFTEKQINRLLSANRRLRGDFDGMRSGAMRAQLGIQQLAFAVDDFMSATGGMEYKVRAISNNLTQFAFVMGGTYGLVLGVAAVLGTQLLMQFTNIGNASKESEEKLKLLNDRLEKSKSLAEENAKAFKELAKSLRDAGAGGLFSGRNAIENVIEERRKAQKEQRQAAVSASSPKSVEAEATAKRLEEELGKTILPARRAELRREIEAARVAAKDAAERAMVAPSFAEVGKSLRRGQELRGRAATAAAPSDNREAISALNVEIGRLVDVQNSNSVFKTLARNAPWLMPQMSAAVDAFNKRDELIGDLEQKRAALEGKASEESAAALNGLTTELLAAKSIIESVYQDLSSLNIDKDIRSKIDTSIFDQTKILEESLNKAAELQAQGKDFSGMEAKARAATTALDALYREADRLASATALGAMKSTRQNLESAAGNVSGVSVVGTNAARMLAGENGLIAAEKSRDRAVLRGDSAAVAAADAEIEALRKLSEELLAASHAVAAFQKAAEAAALNLSSTLLGEASSDAERARRRANRLAGTDMEASSAADRAAAEQRKREAEDFNRQIEADMNAERIKFEREKGGGGRVGELAKQVNEGRLAQGNKELSTEQQAAGKAAADKAEAELQRILEARLKPFRDKVDNRDAAEQARLEVARVQREGVGRRLEFGAGMASDAARMARDNGNVEQAVRLKEIDLELADARRQLADAEAHGVNAAKELTDQIERLSAESDNARESLIDETIARKKNAGAGFEAQAAAAKRELEGSGVFASDVQGQLTEMQTRREAMTKQRDELLADPARKAEAAAIQDQINAMDAMAQDLNAASIAVAAFQEAAMRAAGALQATVAGETGSLAEAARREANRQEALFGAASPEAKEARRRQADLEGKARDALDEKMRANEAIAKERVKFEEEINADRFGAAGARADKIAELEKIAADKDASAAEREAARAEAARLREDQRREFENRPEVQAERRRADEADVRLKDIESAARGRELMKTPFEKQREQIREQAADIANAAADIAAAADRRAKVKQAAVNMAEQAAPMFAQFRDEVLSARLNGPSRAALSASDIQTSQGASELNRLLRGDDPNKNVNLAEMKKQSELLKAIEKAILDTTGQVVEL